MNFQDIPQMTREASYQIDVSWDYMEHQLDLWGERIQGIDLDPDFQRAHVWDEEKQRLYVEFKLRGGRTANELYFNCTTWDGGCNTPVVLVDGKQRLEAVRRFMRGDLAVLGGYTLSDFDGYMPSRNCGFRFFVNSLKTRAEVLQWYIDINAGGIAHTSEEIGKVKLLLEEEN